MKRFFALIPAFLCLFLAATCAGEYDYDYATITIHNQSDFDVTELVLLNFASPVNYITLKQDEKLTVDVEWAPGGPTMLDVMYSINDNHFGTEQMEGSLYFEGGQHYYSPFNIINGAKGFVYIYNESYKVETIGGKYIITEELDH
jgi:hypothetical protein